MAHTPLKITVPDVQVEARYAWTNSYSAAATRGAFESIAKEPAPYKISHFTSRLFFRGIYFPQKGAWPWLKLIAQNRGSVWSVLRDSFTPLAWEPGRCAKQGFDRRSGSADGNIVRPDELQCRANPR